MKAGIIVTIILVPKEQIDVMCGLDKGQMMEKTAK